MRSTSILVALMVVACRGGGEQAEEGHDEAAHGEAGHEEAEAGGHEGEGHAEEVALSPEALQAANLTIVSAERTALGGTVTLTGRVALDPTREAVVSAKTAGQVQDIGVRAGDSVQAGSPLASVQSLELGEAVGTFHGAAARKQAAAARLERLRTLESEGVSSRAQVLEAQADLTEIAAAYEAAEERLRLLGVDPTTVRPDEAGHFPSRFPVRAPISGVVLSSDVSVGQAVQPGDALFHIGNLDEVWVLFDIFERDIGRVQKGQALQFTVDARPGETFDGTVDQVGSWIEPESRTSEIRVLVDNPDHRLTPNMYANAVLQVAAEDGAHGIVVPADALQDVEGRPSVFVHEGAGRFQARPVRVVERAGNQILIEGVEVGEPVVVGGAFTLKSELAKSELGEGHAH